MSCCAAGTSCAPIAGAAADAILAESRVDASGLRHTVLSVPGMTCGSCVQKVEAALRALPGVETARANLSGKSAAIAWRGDAPPDLLQALQRIGYDAHLYDPAATAVDPAVPQLLRALAVAGFAAMNVMLFSASVWHGAEPETRTLFYWLSAAIALPTVAYAGQPFFRSAWKALRHGQTNMDVPISIGVLLTCAMSVYETATGREHAYFDASVSLLFFLLIGRTLDHMMRERARQAVRGLARLAPRGAMVVQENGATLFVPIEDIRPGMRILLAAGERVPVDAVVRHGQSDLDCALVSGESVPQVATPGTRLQAGTLNLAAPLTIEVVAAAQDSFLAEMTRMMQAAEGGRSAYRRVADRAARLYAPVVHATALVALLAWLAVDGDLHHAVTVAVAVLIITCPCALGLAVPMVHVVAAKRLFERGILVKDGAALERLADVDTVAFDKTGTLTTGTQRLANTAEVAPATLALAAALAAHSTHPYSRALVAAAPASAAAAEFDAIREVPGAGLEAMRGGDTYRLGRPDWALAAPHTLPDDGAIVLACNGALVAPFVFDDAIRRGARDAVQALRAAGLAVEVLSGDATPAVRRIADPLGVPYAARLRPGDKVARLRALQDRGRKALMVGDGLNDTAALVAAHASMAPASAADVGRNAADFVFLREDLGAVAQAVTIAQNAATLVRENLAIALAYNVVAVPAAVFGLVTPLVAAIAMSASSLVVVANALRLRAGGQRRAHPARIPTAALQAAE
jgi:Cu2+-exporting ATPase